MVLILSVTHQGAARIIDEPRIQRMYALFAVTHGTAADECIRR